jgi:chromosome segregation ATPase
MVKSRILISSHTYFPISVRVWKLKGQYVYSVNYTFFWPPYSYQESALQALHSSKNQLQSEKDACERRITDLRYLLDEKSSQLTEYSEKIAAMTDNLQRIEKRSSELEIENKSLEGSLREQTTVVDHLQTDLTARELKLRDTISQVSDLCAEVEMKTANGLELKAVSCM